MKSNVTAYLEEIDAVLKKLQTLVYRLPNEERRLVSVAIADLNKAKDAVIKASREGQL